MRNREKELMAELLATRAVLHAALPLLEGYATLLASLPGVHAPKLSAVIASARDALRHPMFNHEEPNDGNADPRH